MVMEQGLDLISAFHCSRGCSKSTKTDAFLCGAVFAPGPGLGEGKG